MEIVDWLEAFFFISKKTCGVFFVGVIFWLKNWGVCLMVDGETSLCLDLLCRYFWAMEKFFEGLKAPNPPEGELFG